jgi:hypothetical protein
MAKETTTNDSLEKEKPSEKEKTIDLAIASIEK